ncbi:hypothetical protein DFP72DRAFT_932192 [Ephemerocybe angulata]|uniref:Uncharacterized protein n=1 Tax=Ephemerocybe angulata TaxID=980116 RepID=A0A8H6LWX2_9AGAR|nr:hypothetical protein DFP72DRAFT_932192 [Tulosesus angulatus]
MQRKRVSKYMWYSGWELSPGDFKQFIRSIPEMGLSGPKYSDLGMIQYISAYDSWRSHTLWRNSPFTPPVLRTRNAVLEDHDSEIIGIFFPIRGIEYQGPEQVEEGHPDSAKIKDVREQDVAKLDVFHSFVKECGGVFDPTLATFAFKKCLHPKFDKWSF